MKFISKVNYEKILNKEYNISVFPYASILILLFDEFGNLIPLICGDVIKYEDLNSMQIQLV